ncbi:MAG TPA: branched-chain amino acid ABC transporter permease, partial [Devosia sp.]
MTELVFFTNQVVIAGAVLGCIYALGAVGITLIFGILRFAHFAHSELMTSGAFFAFLLAALFASWGIVTPIPTGFVVLPIAMVLSAIFALGIDKGFYAPLRKRGARPVTLLIASIGVTLMVQGLIRLFFGAGSYSFFETETKEVFRLDLSSLGSTRPLVITEPQLLMIVVTL